MYVSVVVLTSCNCERRLMGISCVLVTVVMVAFVITVFILIVWNFFTELF